MATHDLKCWPAQFEAVESGRKRFEFRKDDRGFDVGDALLLREWEPDVESLPSGRTTGTYTGRACEVTVTYTLRGSFGVPPGYVVMSLAHPGDAATINHLTEQRDALLAACEGMLALHPISNFREEDARFRRAVDAMRAAIAKAKGGE